MLISVAGSLITPTLATACAALPPEGALAPWGGPAARRITPTLATARVVQEQVGGALSCAAVPRAGLGPATPPLCRYAVQAKRVGSEGDGSAGAQVTPCW
jgi:hypothetical protein